MNAMSLAVLCASILVILTSVEVGRQIGLRWAAHVFEGLAFQTMGASVFGLLGLLVGFTFYGAENRFQRRRDLMTKEANAIGTAYLRLDLLPPKAQPPLRDDFRKYARSRLDVYRKILDAERVRAQLRLSSNLQKKIWNRAVGATEGMGWQDRMLVLTSLNEMIDITTVETVALTTHPPGAVFALLGLAVIASSALAGYTMSSSRGRDWIFVMVFAFVLGAAVYVILDYEYPRVGLIRIDPVDQVLVEALEKMK